MDLSEHEDVYNNLKIYKNNESWTIKDYTVAANNAYKEFKIEAMATNYLNPIKAGEKIVLQYENEKTTKGLGKLATDYKTNFKASLESDNVRLKLDIPNGTTKRFNLMCEDDQEV